MALTSTSVFLQSKAGAYESEFGAHPDEGAHFVTGLMVRDYLRDGIPRHPMRYAENYYAHYPKVALGHYPPGFYVAEGLWLAVFPVNATSVLLFMAVLCGTFGTIIFAVAGRVGGGTPEALMVAGISIVLPLSQTMTFTVMSDMLLATLVLLAALSFGEFVKSGKWVRSLAFGLFAAAAIMTKASGLFLALLPPVVIILTGRYKLLKKWSLWIAVLPVALICLPWLYFSSRITAEGMVDRGVLEHLKLSLPYFAGQLTRVFGYALLLPAVLGVVSWVWRPSSQRDPHCVVLCAVPVCLIAFYSVIPAGLEPRYLLPVVPCVLWMAAAGIRKGSVLFGDRQAVAAWALGVVMVGAFLVETFTIPRKPLFGWRPLVREFVDGRDEATGALRLLISSDARGEGAFISEVAIRDENRPSHTVDRSSKVLAASDWLGRGYQEAFKTDDELLTFLEEQGYDGIVVDEEIPEIFRKPHHARLTRLLQSSDSFEGLPFPTTLGAGHASASRKASLYRRVPASP